MPAADAVFGDAELGGFPVMPAAVAVFGVAVLVYPELPLRAVEMPAADAVLGAHTEDRQDL